MFSQSTVAIVGLGLMGGSLALALRGQVASIIGVTRTNEVAQIALSRDIVDEICSLEEAAHRADIVVLATPVRHIIATIPQVAASMRPRSLLIDLGSTKQGVVAAMNNIPEAIGVAAIGGHPMCGKEVGGIESADANLYRGAPFVLTPTLRTAHDAMLLAQRLAGALGAKTVVLKAEQHDKAVAVISHLPYLLASVLVQAESEASAHDRITGTLAASGFRDTSRLAASQTEMMLDILLTNKEQIGAALDLFEQQLARARGLLDQPNELKKWMQEAQKRRREMFL